MPAKNGLSEKITLRVNDGSSMDAYVSRPNDSSSHPGIIVLQEAFGVNSHIRNMCDRFAAEGYIAIAPELFHRTAPGFEGSYTDFTAVMPHMHAMTNEGAAADLRAAFEWLQAQKNLQQDHIFSTGYCMGGRMSFLANATLPLRAAASFYGGGITSALLNRAPQLHGPMLFCWGGLDKHIPPEQRQAVMDALRGAGKSYVNVEFSDADHGFNCDERASYQPRAARQSWALLLEFLRS
ncbi:MAG TPA: dienelactone hydrolase family protein [Candidatus Angelobacter sp.]|nr:dienelactone hydrolase family protein [Candidatus Angelobacter sp.]